MLNFGLVTAQSSAPGPKHEPVVSVSSPFKDTQASVLLDMLRGLAAVVVLLEHWRNLLFVDYAQVASQRLLYAPFYLCSSAGHQAVIVFFVLSGYLISGSVFRMTARNAWSWKVYLTHRLVRLWVVLLPGLILCAACDNAGLQLRRAPQMYAGLSGNHLVPAVAGRLAPWIFGGNLLFLQGIHVPYFGSNGALWSLAYEFWFYLLFPLGYLAVRRGTATLPRLMCLALFVAIALFVGKGVMLTFPMWLCGTVLALVKPPRLHTSARWVAGAIYLPLFFACSKAKIGPNLCDNLLALATVVLIWVMLSSREPASGGYWAKAAQGLAGCSYTLYVVHMPVCLFLTAFLLGDHRLQPGPRALPMATTVLFLVAVAAFGMAWITESRTDRIRRWVEDRFQRTQRSHG